MMKSNLIALLITFVLAILWLRIIDWLAHRGIINLKDSRKIIHIGTGPIYVACWLLFNEDPSARYIAVLVPFTTTILFFLIGIGVVKDQASIDAMSRTGNPAEILKGPLFYGIIFVLITLFYWSDSAIGIIALMILCGGDGLADIIGNRLGKRKLPWSQGKTFAGSISMFFGGFIFSLILLSIFMLGGVFVFEFQVMIPKLLIICFGAMLVESMKFSNIDNITVPAISILLGHILGI